MTPKPVAVTGATGQLGGAVARRLSAAGIATRLIVRDLARAPSLPGAEAAQADYFDGAAMEAALAGAGRLFFVSGNDLENRLEGHKSVVRAAKRAGVERIVYTSILGAGPDAIFTLSADHWATEAFMAEQGVRFTALRSSFYAEIAEEMVGSGIVRGPGGSGRLAPVAREDVAATAAAMLADPDLPVGPFDVTGPEALTLHEIARVFGEVTGRPAEYVEESVEEAFASRAVFDVPQDRLEAWVSTYTAIAAGELAAVSDAVLRFTGRPPMSFAEFLRRKA